MSRMSTLFRHFAEATARASGRPLAFLLAALVIAVWAVTGPLFAFDDTWQLVINTGTTIVTFLMVFLIQNSQNRDSAALQIKLDELIRATSAHNGLLAVEDLDEAALDRVRDQYRAIAGRRAEARRAGAVGKAAKAAEQADDACSEVQAIDRELDEHQEAETAGAGAATVMSPADTNGPAKS